MEEYLQSAESKLQYNEGLAFWRARVEHFFARGRWGRFLMFKEYIGSMENLNTWVTCSLIAMNIEQYLRHGNTGRYGPLTEEKIEAHRKSMTEHVLQSRRYPRKFEPLPFAEYQGGKRISKRLRKSKGKFISKKKKVRKMRRVVVPSRKAPASRRIDKARAARIVNQADTFPQIGPPSDESITPHPVTSRTWDEVKQHGAYICDEAIHHVVASQFPQNSAFHFVSPVWQATRTPIPASQITKKPKFHLPLWYQDHWILARFKPRKHTEAVEMQVFNSAPNHYRGTEAQLLTHVSKIVSEVLRQEVVVRKMTCAPQEENECAVRVINTILETSYSRLDVWQKLIELRVAETLLAEDDVQPS